MDYRAVTDSTSTQYRLLQSASPDANGLMKIGEYYCVALGSYFGAIGTKYTAVIGGKEYKLIKCDEKQAQHTLNGEGKTGTDGHLIECIVKTESLPASVRTSGNCNALMSGLVERIWKE